MSARRLHVSVQHAQQNLQQRRAAGRQKTKHESSGTDKNAGYFFPSRHHIHLHSHRKTRSSHRRTASGSMVRSISLYFVIELLLLVSALTVMTLNLIFFTRTVWLFIVYLNLLSFNCVGHTLEASQCSISSRQTSRVPEVSLALQDSATCSCCWRRLSCRAWCEQVPERPLFPSTKRNGWCSRAKTSVLEKKSVAVHRRVFDQHITICESHSKIPLSRISGLQLNPGIEGRTEAACSERTSSSNQSSARHRCGYWFANNLKKTKLHVFCWTLQNWSVV